MVLMVFLCDDDKEAVESYSRRIEKTAAEHSIQVSVSCFFNGKDLLFRLSDSPNDADIVYLDIMMDAENGIETAKRLREAGCRAEIVFLTSSEDYVFDAFDVSPVQYLIKGGTSDERFTLVFLRAVSFAAEKKTEMFTCKTTGGGVKVVPFQDILYFEVYVRIVIAHRSRAENLEFYSTLEQLESELAGKNFIRTHRSYLVNMRYISEFMPKSLLLRSGDEIPIGKTYAKTLKEAFSNYITQFKLHQF